MANQKFSAIDLDQLIKDCTGQVDQASTELATYDKSEIAPAGNPSNSELMNKTGQSVDFGRVYFQIEKLIQNGNNALEVLAAIDPDTIEPETIHAMTALMSTIKNCIAEFTKIHAIHLKHQLALETEQIRQQNRLQVITARANARKEASQQEQVKDQQTLIEFSDQSTNDIFRFLQQEKEKREEKQ